MIVRAWRLFKAKHARSAFTGEGARRFGGRWNYKGTRVVYTSENAALAVLETLVHLEPAEMTQHFGLAGCRFDDSLVKTVTIADLSQNWRSDLLEESLRQIGAQWIANAEFPVLRVPSLVIQSEFNYLLNPKHAAFSQIIIERTMPFQLDVRLLKTLPAE